MSESDKLFNFLTGLQPWALMELQRKRVHDLQSALVAANVLVDFKISSKKVEKHDKKFKGNKDSKKESKVKSTKWDKKKQTDTKVGGEKTKEGDSKFKGGCYFCNGLHRAKDCPSKGKLNALVVAAEDSLDLEDPPMV